MTLKASSDWASELAEPRQRRQVAKDIGWRPLFDENLPDRQEAVAPRDLEEWLKELFPSSFNIPFGWHHQDFIEWAATIRPESHPDPYIGIWPRGGGKSTLVECTVIALGAPRPFQYEENGEVYEQHQPARRYCVYVSETQAQADRHVEDIGTRLESRRVQTRYPNLASPKVRQETGQKQSWSRNRLITNNGFIVDALGLNAAARGIKVEDVRPDLLVFDDIDDKHDSRKITQKKETIIKDTIIPTFGRQAAIVGIQNKILPDGVFARLADDRADYLLRRRVSGPYKAVEGLETEKRYDEEVDRYIDEIVEGTPLWEGQDLRECQRRIQESGLSSFLRECQHEVEDIEGALWTRSQIEAVRVSSHPTLSLIVVGVDPSGGTAETGIIVAGITPSGDAYVLEDRSMAGDRPVKWGREVVDAYNEWGANAVIAEKNQGQQMVASTIKSAANNPRNIRVNLVNAKRGKYVRAEPVAAAYGSEEVDYDDTRVHHVGTFPDLEHQMRTYVPGSEASPDRLDALVYALKRLVIQSRSSSIPASTSR